MHILARMWLLIFLSGMFAWRGVFLINAIIKLSSPTKKYKDSVH